MKSLSLLYLFLALGYKGISIKMHSTETRFPIHGTGKCTVCRRLDVIFSPDILQAGAVKGLREATTRFDVQGSQGVNRK